MPTRYYDPATSQFISRDPPVALTRDPYGYVYGNPLNATNPLGLGCLVHNSNGGCAGSSVVTAVQAPIAAIGVLSAGVSAFAGDVALACAVTLDIGCAAIAKGVSTAVGVLNTAATTEAVLYACHEDGPSSSSCHAGIAAFEFSLVNSELGLFVDPLTQVVLSNATSL